MRKPSANMQKSRRAQHMDKQPGFQRYQFEFAAHIRNPRANPRPMGVDSRRMAVYNELLYNNIESFLLTCFPVLRKMLGKRLWNRLVQGFFSGHRSHTPYFRQIPDEFMQYLQSGWNDADAYPAWLIELAHYEWIELVLSVTSLGEQEEITCDQGGDLMRGVPVLNPVLANLAYNWPVHRIRPRAKIARAQTCLLVYRDVDMRVRFMEQSPAAARMVKLLEAGELTGEQAACRLAEELGQGNPSKIMEFARMYLENLRETGVIFGARQ